MPAELSRTHRPAFQRFSLTDLAGTNFTSKAILSRRMWNTMVFPPDSSTILATCSVVFTIFLSIETITSPVLIPALRAGLCEPEAVSTSDIPTTSTPSVNILMPKGVPQGTTTGKSTTFTATFLTGNMPNRRSGAV